MASQKKTQQKFKMFIVQELPHLGYLSVPLTLQFLKKQKEVKLEGNVMTARPTDGIKIIVQMTDEMLNWFLNFLSTKASDEVR